MIRTYIYSEKILIIWQRLRAASTTLVILKPRFTDGGTICPGTIWSYGRGSLAWLEQNELSPRVSRARDNYDSIAVEYCSRNLLSAF